MHKLCFYRRLHHEMLRLAPYLSLMGKRAAVESKDASTGSEDLWPGPEQGTE